MYVGVCCVGVDVYAGVCCVGVDEYAGVRCMGVFCGCVCVCRCVSVLTTMLGMGGCGLVCAHCVVNISIMFMVMFCYNIVTIELWIGWGIYTIILMF